jgi:restriction endonuclease S subunit
MGQSPDGDSYNTTGKGVPLINGPVEFSDGQFGKTLRAKFTTQPTKFCKEGDLILCVRGSTTGRMNIAGFDACIGRGVAAIRSKQYQPWINHFISSKRDEIHGKGTGATFPNVSGATLADLKIPVPPLPEQRRIVAILDEAFECIATAKANAEKNLQNAQAIFDSQLQSIFSDVAISCGKSRLGDVAEVQSGGTPSVSKKDYWGGSIPWYSSGELNSMHTIEPERTITRAGVDSSNTKLFPKGSLLIGMYDTAALKMSLMDRDGCFNQAIAGVKPNNKLV